MELNPVKRNGDRNNAACVKRKLGVLFFLRWLKRGMKKK